MDGRFDQLPSMKFNGEACFVCVAASAAMRPVSAALIVFAAAVPSRIQQKKQGNMAAEEPYLLQNKACSVLNLT
ncbi:hypothetical protein KFK09_017249 [Dendrobium nobile]|uniref:Uncharacterized protein n=1 Tax=Dendrobium nobile TaxID=94219 RepID=A0A8T3B2X0_DENNO|nr:hypothetical protein KFK09_017249 [Dendrobium nobile]